MRNIDLQEKVYWEEWGVNVTPYLTIEQIKLIIENLSLMEDDLDRQMSLICSVIIACTDIYENESKDYTFEEIVYSGLWNELLEKFPYIQYGIDIIVGIINKQDNIENQLKRVIDTIADKLNDFVDNIDDSRLESFAQLIGEQNAYSSEK